LNFYQKKEGNFMAQSKHFIHKETNIGDAAVDGLLAGSAAGILMALYLILVGLLTGPGISAVLSYFDPRPAASPLVGAVTHLAVASVYGALFGLGAWFTPRRWRSKTLGWIMGLAYGLLLLLLAQAILLPNENSPLHQIPRPHFIIAHAIYGLALGLLINQTGAFGGGKRAG
jgi:hypothetical protein